MRITTLGAFFLVLLLPCSSLATELKEINSEVTVAADSETGRPILRFTVWLEYLPTPSRFTFSTSWTTFVHDGSGRAVLEIDERPERDSPGVRLLFSSSPWIPIEPGKRYGADFHYEDITFGLTFDRTFSYTAPSTLPIGIRLRGWDGSDTIDLSGVPDEEVEELALHFHDLTTAYTRDRDNASLDGFLKSLDSDDLSFPAAVFLVPTAGLKIYVGPSDRRETLNVSQSMYLYILSTKDAIAGFRVQLEAFDHEFTGPTFLSTGGTPVLGARSVFVDTLGWDVLEAANLERVERTEDTDS